MKFLNKDFVKNHLLLLILFPAVFIIQNYLFSSHLKYGFDDTADQYTAQFRQIVDRSSNIIQFIKKTFDLPLLWIHEYYYMGIMNMLWDNNLVAYHQTAHLLKALASISTYPLFFVLSGSSLLAFVCSLIFAISYSSAGSLDPVVVNGDYSGIIALSTFLSIYFYLVRRKHDSKKLIYLLAMIFLILSLSIATTRTFPIVLIIFVTEVFMALRDRTTKNLRLVAKRMIIFLLPILLVVIIKPDPILERINAVSSSFNHFVFSSSSPKLNSGGRFELLLIPLLTYASTILPISIWPAKSIVLLSFVTIILGLLLSKKPIRFILTTFLIWFIGLMIINWAWSSSAIQDYLELKTKSGIGFYFLAIACVFFIEWLQNKNRLYIGLFLGPLVSFTFIFCIWLLTQERLLLFTDIHRYLTHSSIFMSFFIGSLLIVLYKRLKSSKWLKLVSILPFLLIPAYLLISADRINQYINEGSKYGSTLKDQDQLRRLLLPYFSDIKRPLLVYIDTESDRQNGYYYRQVYHNGPLFWLFWYNKGINNDTVPRSIFDYNLLKSSLITKDGITGFLYQGVFYSLEDFRAIMIMDKKAFDIKDKVTKDLKL